MDSRIADEQKRVGEGNKIPYERWIDIYADGLRRMRSELRGDKPYVDEKGEFHDFVEVRRPFVAPNNEAATH